MDQVLCLLGTGDREGLRLCPPSACNLVQVVYSWTAGCPWIPVKSFPKHCEYRSFLFCSFWKESLGLSPGPLVGLRLKVMKKHFSRRAGIWRNAWQHSMTLKKRKRKTIGWMDEELYRSSSATVGLRGRCCGRTHAKVLLVQQCLLESAVPLKWIVGKQFIGT